MKIPPHPSPLPKGEGALSAEQLALLVVFLDGVNELLQVQRRTRRQRHDLAAALERLKAALGVGK